MGWRAIICGGSGPRCVIRNMYKEYAAVIRVADPVSRRVNQDQLKTEIIIISSPIRLGEGGKARLASVISSHHDVIKGRVICNPRANTIVRLWVRS